MTTSPRPQLAKRVVDHLPYGVVVVDGSRAVLGSNPAAHRLLPELAQEDGVPACDELLHCAGPGGPCEHGCLAARAAEQGEALPEIRIDTAGDGGPTALWVTAAPIEGEGSALLHLRAGDARDRRRRSDPHWISGPHLRITAFGRTRVDSREGPMGGQWLTQRTGQVLKYLVAERNRVVHADEIAEAIWPGAGMQGVGNVRHFIHQLRDKLEPDRPKRAPSSFVVAVKGGYAINRRRVQIDADEFERAADEGTEAARRDERELAEERLRDALSLYKGDFLADELYAEWALQERDRLRGTAAEALRTLTQLLLDRRDLGAAAVTLEQLAELEPYDADVHRQLLMVWLAEGRRTEAARRYAAFRMRMLREFGEEPGFELAELRALTPAAAER